MYTSQQFRFLRLNLWCATYPNRTWHQMVDQSEYGTNTSYVTDFIEIRFNPQVINSAEIKDLYEKQGLSASQIAEHFGVAKSVILRRLRQLGIDTEKGYRRQSNPNNYRRSKAPYGYKIKNHKLVLNRSEMKVCRLVVEMMGRENKGARETAREIMKRGFKNRQGEVSWGHLVVQQILKRWNGKI